jgi:tetratricopeptide (TPR) repeat protein
MLRTEAVPRSAAFEKGAKAFDQATADWQKRRYAQAAQRFMEASAFFAHDGNAEGNWKYAWQNAALAFEAANKVEEGKVAFEAAAAKDQNSEHAEALRAAGAKLDASHACP